MKNSKLSIFLKGIIAENPVLVLVLGTCPVLAVTKNGIVAAISMGIAATFVLLCSNVVISLLRKIIPDTVRIPCYIVIIASFVTLVKLLLQSTDELYKIYELLGTWLDLIVVNCVILGRAEMFARKNKVFDSALDGLGMGVGFLAALVLMAGIREIFGTGAIDFSKFGMSIVSIPVLKTYNIPFLVQDAGGFLVYGILIAIVNAIGPKKGAEKRKNFSCEGCPSASICGRVSCSENAELVSASENNTLVEKEEA
ncbi:MAG: electron transport complex subunit RsxE [Clostridia bacterium]|nr:electron transport complex subunit RsxE [Clostridia bacterium]